MARTVQVPTPTVTGQVPTWNDATKVWDNLAGGTGGVQLDSGSTGTLNNFDASDGGTPATVVVFTGGSAITLTGIAAGAEGRVLWIVREEGSAAITFAHNSGSSSNGNKIQTPDEADMVFGDGRAFALIYDSTGDYWYLDVPTTNTSAFGDGTEVNVTVAGSNIILDATQCAASHLVLIGTPGATRTINYSSIVSVNSGFVRCRRITNLTNADQTISCDGGTNYTLQYYLGAIDDYRVGDTRYSTEVRMARNSGGTDGVFAFPDWTHSP